MDPWNWKWMNICFFGIKRICRRGRNWYPLHSSNLSWAPNYISPRWINISILTITSKTCETLLKFQSYRLIAKWIAFLDRWLSCKVDSCGCWFNFEWMSRQWNQISLICIGRQQKLFFFFQLHTVMKLFFNDINIFKSKRGYHLQQDDDIRWCALTTTSPYFDKLVKQTQRKGSHWNLWMRAMNEFSKTSICIILVVLVYLESAKICTGPKIVRGLKSWEPLF